MLEDAAASRSKTLLLVALTAGLGLATVGTFFVMPLLAPLPVLGVAGLWVLTKIPLRYLAFTLYFLVLSVDMITENPWSHIWKDAPLNFPGHLLFEQLNSLTGVGFLRFPLVEGLILLMLGIHVYRRATKQQIDPKVVPMPLPLVLAMALSPLSILVVEVHGVATGGNLQNSLWQWQQLMVLALVVMLYNVVIRGPEDFGLIMKIVVAGGFIKAVQSFYFIVFVARPLMKDPEYATCHSDSMTYVMSLVLALVPWLEKPTFKKFVRICVIYFVTFIGLYYNDRRLAWVSFGGTLAVVFLMSPWTQLKRLLVRVGSVAAPVIALYVAVGWNHDSGIFKPVHTIKTLVEGEHLPGFMDYRDIENWDVINTWKLHPILGNGYGHEFIEPIKLPDIAFVFPQYRYHPHNSLLGLFAWGGPIGVTGIWMYLAVTVFMAARAYHRAHAPLWRTACISVICFVACYLNQCFGDMGVISWIGVFHMGIAVSVAGKMAHLTGAWPSRHNAALRARPRPVSTQATAAGATEAVR